MGLPSASMSVGVDTCAKKGKQDHTLASRDQIVRIVFLQRREADMGDGTRVTVAGQGHILPRKLGGIGSHGEGNCWLSVVYLLRSATQRKDYECKEHKAERPLVDNANR
jgi:hypothetical protein